jgi:hypothetical protein
MDNDRGKKEAEERALKNTITVGLTDQKTMNQLSSSGKMAQDRRAPGQMKRQEAARAKEEASGKGSGSRSG